MCPYPYPYPYPYPFQESLTQITQRRLDIPEENTKTYFEASEGMRVDCGLNWHGSGL